MVLDYAGNGLFYKQNIKFNAKKMMDNCGLDFSEADIDLPDFDFQRNRFELTLDVDFEIVHENPTITAGVDEPSSAHACKDKYDVQTRIAQEFQEKLRDPGFTEDLRSALAKYPERSLIEYNEEVTHAHSETYHHHENCSVCSGYKKRPCSNPKCLDGRENCPAGCKNGYRICWRCHGIGTVQYQDKYGMHRHALCPNPKCRGGQEKCGACDDGTKKCLTCDGLAFMTCNACQVSGKPTGKVTLHQRARLVRKPTQGCRHLDIPHTWVAERLEDDVSRILFWSMQTVEAETIQRDDRGFQVRLTAVVPSGEGKLAIGQHEARVTAIGEYADIWFEDAVLERILDDHRDQILNATGREAFMIAEQNVVFAEAARVARSGDTFDTSDFQQLLNANALTTDFLSPVQNHLDSCVDSLMRKPYWGSWASAAPVIALSGAAMWFFDPLLGAADQIDQAQHVREWRMVADAVLPVMLAFIAAVVARVRGRFNAASALDRSDVRGVKPRGGFFAGFSAVVAALALTWTGTEGPGRGPRPLAESPVQVLRVGLTNVAFNIGLNNGAGEQQSDTSRAETGKDADAPLKGSESESHD